MATQGWAACQGWLVCGTPYRNVEPGGNGGAIAGWWGSRRARYQALRPTHWPTPGSRADGKLINHPNVNWHAMLAKTKGFFLEDLLMEFHGISWRGAVMRPSGLLASLDGRMGEWNGQALYWVQRGGGCFYGNTGRQRGLSIYRDWPNCPGLSPRIH